MGSILDDFRLAARSGVAIGSSLQSPRRAPSQAGSTAWAPPTPMTFAVVAVSMLAVALAASWVPAYRASRTDATEALRHD